MSNSTHTIRLHRVFRAPAERVFRVFLEPEVQLILETIRSTIKAAAPETAEKIGYRMPTFMQNGVPPR